MEEARLQAELASLKDQIAFTDEMIKSRTKAIQAMNDAHEANIQKLAAATRKAKQRQRNASDKRSHRYEALNALNYGTGDEDSLTEDDEDVDTDDDNEEGADDIQDGLPAYLALFEVNALKEVIGEEQLGLFIEDRLLKMDSSQRESSTGGSDSLLAMRAAIEGRLKEVAAVRKRLDEFMIAEGRTDLEDIEKKVAAASGPVPVTF
mmetsp:Transcript_58892/g.108786  ORF Transcript_58892/g.108786 Transcript_58892/m.108786 type:complete len:206 (-) Transcript_58892:92-709(-)